MTFHLALIHWPVWHMRPTRGCATVSNDLSDIWDLPVAALMSALVFGSSHKGGNKGGDSTNAKMMMMILNLNIKFRQPFTNITQADTVKFQIKRTKQNKNLTKMKQIQLICR